MDEFTITIKMQAQVIARQEHEKAEIVQNARKEIEALKARIAELEKPEPEPSS